MQMMRSTSCLVPWCALACTLVLRRLWRARLMSLSLQCRWRFHLQELTDGHWVSVARGPPETIVDAWQEFTGTLKEPIIATARFQVSSPALRRVFHLPGRYCSRGFQHGMLCTQLCRRCSKVATRHHKTGTTCECTRAAHPSGRPVQCSHCDAITMSKSSTVLAGGPSGTQPCLQDAPNRRPYTREEERRV